MIELDEVATRVTNTKIVEPPTMGWISRRSAARRTRRRLAQGLVVGVFMLLGAVGILAVQTQGSDSTGQLVSATQGEQAATDDDQSVEENPPAAVPTASVADVPEDPTLVDLPVVSGLSFSDAVAMLESVGLLAISEPPGQGDADSLVFMTDPPAGTLLARATEVRLFVQPIEPDPTPPLGVAAVAHTVLAEDFATDATSTDFLTEIATDAQQLEALLLALDLADGEPVDFDTSVVLYFATVQSGSCPLAPLETLAYRAEDSRIYPLTEIVPIDDLNWVCTADAQARGTLVSVDRADLPKTDFSLWIDESTRTCCIGLQVVSVAGL